MKGVKYFKPFEERDEAFCLAVKKAKQEGVKIIAYDTNVSREGISIGDRVKCII
jgi:sugar fermentation stimulation protein A